MVEQLKTDAPRRVLIAYAPEYGATQLVAEHIGKTLDATGLRAEVRAAVEVVHIYLYEAVILGSSVYHARWLPEAVEFFESFQEELASKPLWLFSDDPTELGGVQVQISRRLPEALAALVRVTKPEDVALFGGVYSDSLDSDGAPANRALRGEPSGQRDLKIAEVWANTISTWLQDRFVTATSKEHKYMPTQHKHFTEADARRIGESLHVKWEAFNVEQFRMGMDVELEHGRVAPETDVTHDNSDLTGKIALAHLNEFPDYYTRLATMEVEAKAFWGSPQNTLKAKP